MDPIQIMEASAAKWQRILEGKGADYGMFDCPPCEQFQPRLCNGCPVAEYTGQNFCKGTPYVQWIWHHQDVHRRTKRKVYCPQCRTLAQDMHAFILDVINYLQNR